MTIIPSSLELQCESFFLIQFPPLDPLPLSRVHTQHFVHLLTSARAHNSFIVSPIVLTSYTQLSLNIIIKQCTDARSTNTHTPPIQHATQPHKKTPPPSHQPLPLAYLVQDGHQFHHSALAVGTCQVHHKVVSILEADHQPLVPVATDTHTLDLG